MPMSLVLVGTIGGISRPKCFETAGLSRKRLGSTSQPSVPLTALFVRRVICGMALPISTFHQTGLAESCRGTLAYDVQSLAGWCCWALPEPLHVER